MDDQAQATLPTDEELRRENERRIKDRLQVFGARLKASFDEQVRLKSAIEERWRRELKSYNGEYDETVLQKIKDRGGSEAYVNFVRNKCNSVESRLCDMLLPTDDRNWAIEPTPVPELKIARRKGDVVMDRQGNPATDAKGRVIKQADLLEEKQKDAKAASELMQQEMDDQLQEASYNAVQRMVIHYQVVYGTGILKGPVIRNRVRQEFAQADVAVHVVVDGQPQTVTKKLWRMTPREDLRPGAEAVSPWDFFPDMRAARIDDAEFVFERHRYNTRQLQELAKTPGFIKGAINDLLGTQPQDVMSGLVDQADTADVIATGAKRGRWEVVEYTGPIAPEDLEAAGFEIDREDRLTSYPGSVWFCNGIVIKAAPAMLDSGESMYDVVPLERDDTSIFGYGVPHMMADSSAAGNAAWRMVLDNAALSVGPQVIKKAGKVKQNGRSTNDRLTLQPFGEIEVLDGTPISEAIQLVEIKPNFNEMFAIIQMVEQFMDKETGLPMIAQGEQSPAITKTAQGMAILMNSANTVLRRLVKEYDDCITSRFIKRLYHWNMQFGEVEEAKGDYCILALGSSSLLVREQQTQALMQLSQLALTNPEFMKRTDWDMLYRTLVKVLNISSAGVIKSKEQVEAEDEAAKQQQPQVPPEIQLAMAELQLTAQKYQSDASLAQAEIQLKTALAQADAAEKDAKNEVDREKIAVAREAAQLAHRAAMATAQARLVSAQVARETAQARLAAERERMAIGAQTQLGVRAMAEDGSNQRLNAELALATSPHGKGI